MHFQDIANGENKPIGIIFSKSDEGQYVARIISNGNVTVVKSWLRQEMHYHSLQDAKLALRRLNVSKAYLALDNTYDEFVSFSAQDHQRNVDTRHDYMPISLYQ